MSGILYLVNVKNMNRVPCSVRNKFFIVRSCKNSDYYIRQGWRILPQISPEPELFRTYLDLKKNGDWNRDTYDSIYVPQFIKQMKADMVMRNTLNNVKAMLDMGQDVAFMCYCDTDMCHRFILGAQYEMRGYNVLDLCKDY